MASTPAPLSALRAGRVQASVTQPTTPAAKVGEADEEGDKGTDDEVGAVRHLERGVDGIEPSRELAVGGHGEHGAADAGDERQEDPEGRDGSADAHDGRERVEVAGSHGGGQRHV